MALVVIKRDRFGRPTETVEQYSEELLALSEERKISPEWLKPNCTRGDNHWILKGFSGATQYKPDEPFKNEEGKPVKYVSPKRLKPDAMIPTCPDSVDHPLQACSEGGTLYVTEGFFKAVKACEVGIPTIAVTGVWNGAVKDANKRRVLAPSLRDLIEAGVGKVCIAFDADAATNPDVHKASVELASLLQDAGCTVTIATGQWTIEEGKGMDDFISKNGVEAMRERLERALTLDEYKTHFALKTPTKESGKNKENLEVLKKHYKGGLKLNQMSGEVEHDGEPLDAELIHVELMDKGVIDLKKDTALDYVSYIARENAYHPVRDYLDGLKGMDSTRHVFETRSPSEGDAFLSYHLESLASHWKNIFGNLSPIEMTYLTKTLVGAVSRARKPGCMMQTMLVLCGAQGTRKSTFLRELAGYKNFSNAYRGTVDKDDLLKLHTRWIHEIAELDKIFNKTDTATLKDIITTEDDLIRAPYARTTKPIARASILTATTNRWDVLKDPTGARRFWIVRVTQKIDTTRLKEVRDVLWSHAVALHEAGYPYFLDEAQQSQSDFLNEMFQDIDPIRDAVEDYVFPCGRGLDTKSPVCVQEIYESMNPDKVGGKPTKQDERAITDALRRFGYTPGGDSVKVTWQGKRLRCWVNSCTGENSPVQDRYTTGHHAQQELQPFVPVVPVNSQTFTKTEKVDDISLTSAENIKVNVLPILPVQPVQKTGNPVTVSDYPCTGNCTGTVPVNDSPAQNNDPYNDNYTPKVGDEIVVTGGEVQAIIGQRHTITCVYSNKGVQVMYTQKTIAGKGAPKPAILRRDQYKPTTTAITP